VFIFKIEKQERTEKIGTNKPQKEKDEIKETINTMKFLVLATHTSTL